ncbi:hypothetical protein K435DRAFT_877612 [Dendrothele bispora CBS 962.96]|uniref:Uncharacterized protein n=1 Tax=Dendrothele bispora (strain CBS 962.96) TaxID=1314807 RepID=A0A4S8KPL5_DENBC|nr:hypothetical protein K435DRAFT_877612 [Dendrothele bispora CBS 962.96]
MSSTSTTRNTFSHHGIMPSGANPGPSAGPSRRQSTSSTTSQSRIPRPVASSIPTNNDANNNNQMTSPTSGRDSLFDGNESPGNVERNITASPNHGSSPEIPQGSSDSARPQSSQASESRTADQEHSLRLRYLLQVLRDDELANWSTTSIPDQQIHETTGGHVYHVND